MSYLDGLSYTKRRPPTQHLSPDEAVARLNTVVDDANAQIARMLARAEVMEQTARFYEAENKELRARIAELEKQVKRLTPKAGKGRRVRMEDDH